ncbi:hypothetical protein GCM10010531_33180 [Blastococcus jejuensis]|uniref:Secreted protein n=1 Tax=Blastococcus jejuensis TaxID=351224 RepID=A0ABP6PF58_9ACTN
MVPNRFFSDISVFLLRGSGWAGAAPVGEECRRAGRRESGERRIPDDRNHVFARRLRGPVEQDESVDTYTHGHAEPVARV